HRSGAPLIALNQHTLPFLVLLSSRAQPGSRQLDDRRPQPGADPSLPTAVSIPPTLAIALVWPGRQYLSQFRLGQFQYHLPNSSSQRFAQPIRSKKTFHLAETLYTFPHRRIPPRSDSPHEPDSFLGYRENTPSLFSTTSGPPPAHARGTERFGLVASSKAQRLKPHAVDIRVDVNPVHWFLNGKEDTRSSYYLEDAATEFQVQGLELDWACVTWDGDLRFTGSTWSFHDFRGDRWCNVASGENRRYLRNAYRVLLTRARQGMVIFVPPGDASDPTRSPDFYDPTFKYLRHLGIPALS